MIDLLIALGAAAAANSLPVPDYDYDLPAQLIGSAPLKPAETKEWTPPKVRFDDSQDCLTFLTRKIAGFGTVRVSTHCSKPVDQPAPWRSL